MSDLTTFSCWECSGPVLFCGPCRTFSCPSTDGQDTRDEACGQRHVCPPEVLAAKLEALKDQSFVMLEEAFREAPPFRSVQQRQQQIKEAT